MRKRAARFEERYGRAPSQREFAQLAQASNFSTRKGKEGGLDVAQLHAGWEDTLTRTISVPLASVAPSVWHADAISADAPKSAETQAPNAVLEELAMTRASQQALVLTLDRQRRRDLVLPQPAAGALSVLAGRVSRVCCLAGLSDGRRVSVINAPAGSGKTRVLAEIASAWQGAGLGPVIGITASQSARNTLAQAV